MWQISSQTSGSGFSLGGRAMTAQSPGPHRQEQCSTHGLPIPHPINEGGVSLRPLRQRVVHLQTKVASTAEINALSLSRGHGSPILAIPFSWDLLRAKAVGLQSLVQAFHVSLKLLCPVQRLGNSAQAASTFAPNFNNCFTASRTSASERS